MGKRKWKGGVLSRLDVEVSISEGVSPSGRRSAMSDWVLFAMVGLDGLGACWNP